MFLGINETAAILLSALLAAVFAGWAVVSQRSLAARQATIEFMLRSESDRDMIKYRNDFSRLSREPTEIGTFAVDPLSDEFRSIRSVLNEYEAVAIAIQTGTFDERTYRLWYRSGVVKAWNAAAPFVVARRNQTSNQALWHEFEEMARYYLGGQSMPRRHFWRKFF